MRSAFSLRFLALLLAVFTVFGTLSCTRKDPDSQAGTEPAGNSGIGASDPIGEGQLTIEAPEDLLTAENRSEMAARLAATVANLIRAAEGLVLDEDNLESIHRFAENRILPILEAEEMTLTEGNRICAALDTLSEEWQTNGAFSARLLHRFWQDGVLLIGKDRFGRICYACALLCMDMQIEKNDERYETYGYEWYKTDAEALRRERANLTEEVGSQPFADVCETLWAISSLADEIFAPASGSQLLNDAEIVKLLQAIIRELHQKEITSRQWEISVRAACLLLPDSAKMPSSFSDQQKKEWRALLRNDYPATFSRSIPALIDLFDAVGAVMTGEDYAALRDGAEAEKITVLCRLLVACQDRLRAFLNALAENGATSTEEEKKTVSKRTADYEAFLIAHPAAGADTVWTAICARAEGGTERESDRALLDVLIGYGVSFAPYLTFAFAENLT